MNATTDFDLGPLTWVKGEIDSALERAEDALHQYVDHSDPTQLKFCRTHVHQVHGALAIVGLDGITQVTEGLEGLLQAVEEGKVEGSPSAFTAVKQAMAALRHYLDDLMGGEPNQPLRLLPAYQALAAARGGKPALPTDLFYPDLNVRPPKPKAPVPKLSAEELQALVKTERARFQKGLLIWLKKPDEAGEGLEQMRTAVAHIEASQESPTARAFWWVAQGFLDTLADRSSTNELEAKQLCARIDLQMRRLLEGSRNVAERLMRDVLYHIALAPAREGESQAIREAFQLDGLLPATSAPVVVAPQESLLRRLRETAAATEEFWNKFCAGSTGMLANFAEHARACAQLTAEVGHTDLKRLGQGIAAMASWLLEQPSRHNDTIAMEVTTAILLLQNAQENFRHLGTDFAQQVDLMVARLHSCIAGKPLEGTGNLPLLDEMARRAQEKLLVGQVAREIQNNLAQIEQSLDAFFREPDKTQDLLQLEAPLKQVSGAFSMLGQEGAIRVLEQCREEIQRFAQPGYEPAHEDFEAVAHQFSTLGFFVDSLSYGQTDFDTFVRKLKGEAVVPDEKPEEHVTDAPPTPTVETQLERQKREAQALVEALKEKPEDAQLKDELRQNLQALQKDADLVADQHLSDTAKAALSALSKEAAAPADLDAAMSSLKPAAIEAPAPSAETLELAQSSGDEIDAELLGIFLEEAREVLTAIGTQLEFLKTEPHNTEALITIRRSTHTLKGSGRMVGLTDLGETAWAIEQTLNWWLRQEIEVTSDLITMIALEHSVFTDWIHHLENHSTPQPNPISLINLAEKLRGAEPLPLAASTPAPAASALEAPVTTPSAQIIELPVGRFSRPVSEEPAVSGEEDVKSLSNDNDFPELTDVAEPAEALVSEKPQSAPPPPAPAVPSPTLYDIFQVEARSHLDTLVTCLQALEQQPEAPTSFDMTRAAHTLGGIAATVGLMPINRLAITLEHALLRRDGCTRPDSAEGLETVRQAITTLEDQFSALAEKRSPELPSAMIQALEDIYQLPPADEDRISDSAIQDQDVALEHPAFKDELDEQLLSIFLEEAQDLAQGFGDQLRAWRANPTDSAAPRALARLLHTFKGGARMAGAMNLGEATHLLENRVEEILAGKEPATIAQIEEIESGCDGLVQMLDRLQHADTPALSDLALLEISEGAPSDLPEGEGTDAGSQRATLRVKADVLDRLINEAGELSIARARIEGEMRSLKGSLSELTENVIRLRRQLREIEIQAETQMQVHTVQTQEGKTGFDPLELDRFTRFQELTRFMAESVNDVATLQQNLLKNLDDANAAILAQSRLNRSLQQELMGVRMVPFESQSERLYRIVRQTAKDAGKRANLDIQGGQVEIDRSVLDRMLPPLEHMLRNAITHGIESREERAAAGKPEIGEISLALQQEGNEIVLTMADDGRGLDSSRIRAKAEALGLLASGEAADESKLFEFIFHPGFTTASQVTQVAGRGVGMDVVRTEVASLGGRIEIVSVPGRGTTFRLYLPLTLAVTQTLLVRVGANLYAIPSTMIEQVQELKEKALRPLQEKGEVNWMGNRYPLHFLPRLLGDSETQPEPRRQYWILLLRSGTQRVAVQVDEMRGNQEVVVKNIGPQLARVVGIAGATVLGDGQVVLILNPVALASRSPSSAPISTIPAAPAPAVTNSRAPTVMVVDDSLTVRKITGRLLTREGYQVITAKDGVDALEQLLEARPDVVLSDVEMPRMDGFDLLRNIRADEHLKSVPVIMITSRTAEKHRNYALEIGADHYLGKPYDEEELLRLIAGYVAAGRGSA